MSPPRACCIKCILVCFASVCNMCVINMYALLTSWVNNMQGCVIRSFGTFNTKYAYNMIVFVKRFWECRFLAQNGPDSPQIHPKRLQFFSNILHVINILYDSIESSLKGRLWGGNCLKRPKIGKFSDCITRPICSIW